MNLKLKKFNMSSIKDDKVVIFIGKRDTVPLSFYT